MPPRALSAILLTGLLGCGDAIAATADACAGAPSAAVIVDVTTTAELILDPPLTLRLADLRLPDEASARAADYLRRYRGTTVEIRAAPPDRWGGQAGIAVVSDRAVKLDLAEGLVEEGLVLVDTGEADRLCQPKLLALEATARERGIGVWGSGRYKPVAASDEAGLKPQIGRFYLVEGRIRSVGERRERTYLNFGAQWSTDLTIVIPRQAWRAMRDRGVTAAGLRQRRIRARGLLTESGGPLLTITSPDMLELLDDPSAQRERSPALGSDASRRPRAER